ncbi:MAG: hypothetical protein O3C27_09965 [Actinomycetota bacterium]|nr:hypothetical protein [Actinomycetota bacterium]
MQLKLRCLKNSADLQERRADDHDEQGGEDAKSQGEDELDRQLERGFLGSKSALGPHLIGLDAQGPGQWYAHAFGLAKRQHEVADVVALRALGQVFQGVDPVDAQPDVLQRPGELECEDRIAR